METYTFNYTNFKIPESNIRRKDASGNCDAWNNEDLIFDGTSLMAIYLDSVDAIPHQKIVNSQLTITNFLGKKNVNWYFDVTIYTGVSKSTFEQCNFDGLDSPFHHSSVRLYATGSTTAKLYSLHALLTKAAHTGHWLFGNPVLILLRPKDPSFNFGLGNETKVSGWFQNHFGK